MRTLLVVLLVAGVAAVVTVAAAQQRDAAPPAASGQEQALPSPDLALPQRPGALSVALEDTTRGLRDALARWDPSAAVPDDVVYLALHQQRMLRLMAKRRALGDAALAASARRFAGRRATPCADCATSPTSRASPKDMPRVRVARAAPAAELRRHYGDAQRRFGVHWTILASVNFVESAFGRVRSASEAGARGPMQFLPATWRAYGMGGDIDDPRDAILAAANYLRASGARHDIDRALFAYNHSTSYVRAIRRFAARMRTDERAFLAYYAWQVFVRAPGGGARRLTGPGR